MRLNTLIKDLCFDKRIVEWGVRYNVITYKDYRNYLKSLPDLSDKKKSIIDIPVEQQNTLEEDQEPSAE